MTIEEIKKKLAGSEYDFLRTNEHLGENIILLGLGGSYAYGNAIDEISDLDIRGCALNTKEQVLLGTDFGSVNKQAMDVKIHSFKRLIHLLTGNNPSIIELIGLKKEHYLYLHPIGQEIIDNKDMFIYKKVISAFHGCIHDTINNMNKQEDLLKKAKGMSHIIRLYNMLFDLVETGEIITYRESDHELLMDLRNGKYLLENGIPNKAYYDMLSERESLLKRCQNDNNLPDEPDYKAIQKFVMSVNERVVRGEV